ncbi:hypothetical protein H4Q26_004291 [Puccinia striiformis f. sp. tritici PST-130]|nr:hypothetical protein H4Q26_004291 [Puccinia striiformis f. sp. tritici PST-130]
MDQQSSATSFIEQDDPKSVAPVVNPEVTHYIPPVSPAFDGESWAANLSAEANTTAQAAAPATAISQPLHGMVPQSQISKRLDPLCIHISPTNGLSSAIHIQLVPPSLVWPPTTSNGSSIWLFSQPGVTRTAGWPS